MPIIFVIDCSLSMFLPLSKESSETLLNASQFGIWSSIELLSKSYQQSVLMAMGSISSKFELLVPFTKDILNAKSSVGAFSCGYDVDVSALIMGVNKVVLDNWSLTQTVTVVVVTDGGLSIPLLKSLETPSNESTFAFPVKFHLIFVSSEEIENFNYAPQWGKVIESTSGIVHKMNFNSVSSAISAFTRFAAENLQLSPVKLQLGCLSTFASIYPNVSFSFSDEYVTFEIGGFLQAGNEIYNAEALSRHLLIPRESDGASEESKESSLISGLYTVLKQESAVALCKVINLDDHYAILHISSEQRKRPGLNLAVMKPGPIPIPWLGPISALTLTALAPASPSPIFQKKKSYNEASSYIGWSKAEGLKADVQRILRLAKKLPDKSTLFFKELNKLRSSSLTLGTPDLLTVLASALLREANIVASADGKTMLNFCVEQLQSGPASQEIEAEINFQAKQTALSWQISP